MPEDGPFVSWSRRFDSLDCLQMVDSEIYDSTFSEFNSFSTDKAGAVRRL